MGLIAGVFTASADEIIESDWLFQCDGEPTIQVIRNEIGYTRDVLKRTGANAEASKALDKLEQTAAAVQADAVDTNLYFAVRKLKRDLFLKQPEVKFGNVLAIDQPYPKGPKGDATDEWGHEARHRNGFMGHNGGKLLNITINPTGNGTIKSLLPELKGAYYRPDLSFDGKKIVFCYKPENERSYHIYECDADGKNIKQLTFGDYDDLDPIYMPNGKIVFCTSRQHSYVRCMPMTHSFALARCDADGKNIYILSANGEPEYLPSILNDGRIIFTRWEYTDKALWRVQSLWTCDPDGCNVQTFWGSQSVWPDVLTEVRAIPNSQKVMFTGLGHHAWWNGSIGMIDPNKGLNYPDGLERVTRDLEWPEVSNGPKDPPPSVPYHNSGRIGAYKTPYPLSEELFLVSGRDGAFNLQANKMPGGTWNAGNHLYNGEHGRDWVFRLYLMDIYGNKELIYKGDYNVFHAMPFAPRKAPPALADKITFPKIGPDQPPLEPVNFYSNDVFENAPAILREKGKAIRVIQMDPKTYTTWNKTVQHDGPAVSVFQADGVKRILGTVPIEDDGSVNFYVPPGEALFFEMLDADGMAIYVMRSFANGMPGERRGCFGCHETSMKTRATQASSLHKRGKALAKPAVHLTPPPWGAGESVGYKRFVQPVLEKHCASCHNKSGSDANKALDMTYRPSMHGWWADVCHRPWDVSPFYEPYYTLVSGACPWGNDKPKDGYGVPKNLAGLFVVEGYGQNDPKNLETLPPYTAYSPVSRLVQYAVSGKHHGVKVTGLDRERLIAWVDCNGPFLGDEEIREMYDPWSTQIEAGPLIRPRIRTAPRINRFNLRQDGDTMAMCGPLQLMPNRENNTNALLRISQHRDKNLLEEYKNETNLIVIVSAYYGLYDKSEGADVSVKLKPFQTGKRQLRTIGNYNSVFGDTLPGVQKQLVVDYTIDGEPKTAYFPENASILLPK